MAKFKKSLSVLLVFVMLISLTMPIISVSAALPEELDKAEASSNQEYLHSLSYLTQYYGYDKEKLQHENIDSVDYIYTVENGEASILNIHTQFKGPEKVVLTLPTILGGYPVTILGSVENCLEVFWFIKYDEILGTDPDYGGEYEYDPGLKYVSKIVIPEGYEYIANGAFHNFDVYEWEFPKSLKIIYDSPFDYMYTEYNDLLGYVLVLPECKYGDLQYFAYLLNATCGDRLDKIVAPSRDTALSLSLFKEIGIGYSQNNAVKIYLPSNLSYDNVKSRFFDRYESSWYPEFGEWDATLSFACAPDSEWLKVFEDYPGYNINVTYVEPATHIAFDNEAVSIKVGEVVDLEAKTYPAEAVWTACDYVSSNPEVVKVDPYSGRITALAEGEATITATHVERGFVDTCTVTVEPYVEHECTYSTEWSFDEVGHWYDCTDSECEETTNYAEHSGGNATVNAKAVCEYCGTAYGEFAKASFAVEPVSDIAYCKYSSREYKVTVSGSPDKIQFIRYTGTTSTYTRSQAKITDNGDGTETWVVTARLNKGAYTLAAKYGKVWNKNGVQFEIVFDTPSCRSFTSEKTGSITTFTVVTDPQVTKIQFITQSGGTLTYSQANSYIGEDGLRYWIVSRKITKPGTIGLRIKYASTWNTTEFRIEV